MKIVNLLFALLIMVGATLSPSSASARMLDGTKPVNVTVNPSSPGQGDTVLVTVTMDSYAAVNTSVAITAMGSVWASCPTSVTVPQGYDQVSFYATISTTAYGIGKVVATANGESAACQQFFVDFDL